MKKITIIILGVLFVSGILVTDSFVGAHPGNTDRKGCHTCRTNCRKWGLRNGQYHCHKRR